MFLVFGGLCNGTFGVLLKLGKKRNPRMPLFVMFLYYGLGQIVMYLLSMTLNCFYLVDHFAPDAHCFEYTNFGIVSACCNAIGVYATFIALFNLGVAITPSIYAPTVIFTAMITETCLSSPNKHVESPPMLVASIVCIAGGAFLVALAKYVAEVQRSRRTIAKQASDIEAALNVNEPEVGAKNEMPHDGQREFIVETTSGEAETHHLKPASEEKPNVARGLFAAIVGVGIFGGAVPYWVSPTFVPSHAFVPAFGTAPATAIGSAIVFPVVAALHFAYLKTTGTLPALKDWGLVSVFPWGFVSGLVFALGPLGVEYAVAVKASDPGNLFAQAPATYAVSIWQTGILVSGLWGILLFKEMDTVASIAIFVLGAGVLLAGIFVSGQAIV
jgi:hypothetical protein